MMNVVRTATWLVLVWPALAGERPARGAGPEEAGAHRVSVLVVALDAFGARAAEYIEQLGLAQLRLRPGNQVVEPEQLLRQQEASRQRLLWQQVGQELATAIGAYENLELDRAVELLQRLERRLLRELLPGEQRRWRLLAQVLKYLGAAQLLRGEPESGQQAFWRLLTMNDQAQLDSEVFPPRLVQLFETVRREVLSQPRSVLRVTSVPANARIYLDGRFRCVTPCRIAGLNPGRHLLLGRRLGYEAVGRPVMVAAAAMAHENLRLLDLAGGQQLRRRLVQGASYLVREKRVAALLATHLSRYGLREVVLGWVGRGSAGVSLRLVRAELPSGRVLAAAGKDLDPRAADFAARVTDMLAGLQAGTGLEQLAQDELLGGRIDVTSEETGGVFSSWWFWTSVGAVLATGAVLLAVLLPRSSEPQSMIVLQF